MATQPAKAVRTEDAWEQKLQIDTAGRDDTLADAVHHPYEPTPYSVLERLAESGYLTSDNRLVDYGCGKGRAAFFFRAVVGCRTVGVEYDPNIFRQAMENHARFAGRDGVELVCGRAEAFEVGDADAFYFFNPFTEEILHAVLRKIMDSYYENPRQMRLFFYYPDDAYLRCLLTGEPAGLADALYFLDEIDCRDLFDGSDPRERILIFETDPDAYSDYVE